MKARKTAAERMAARLGDALGVVRGTLPLIARDLHELLAKGEERLFATLDHVFEEKKVSEIVGLAMDSAKRGKEAAQQRIRAEYASSQDWLDERVKHRPEVVGFLDGFVNAFANTAFNRRPRSQIYITHIRYGKAVGFALAGVLFVGGIGVAALVGATPVLTRLIAYLKKKVADARAAEANPKAARARGQPAAGKRRRTGKEGRQS